MINLMYIHTIVEEILMPKSGLVDDKFLLEFTRGAEIGYRTSLMGMPRSLFVGRTRNVLSLRRCGYGRT